MSAKLAMGGGSKRKSKTSRAPNVIAWRARTRSAVGATEVSPARKGWAIKSTRSACLPTGKLSICAVSSAQAVSAGAALRKYGVTKNLRARLFVFFDFSVAHADHAVGMQGDVGLVRHQNNCVAALV
jgi:hypothetical protein